MNPNRSTPTSLFDAPSPNPHQSLSPAGYVGILTANSFMKREFGKALIEKFIPTIDLTHVIDTSGAYIPGHGTPTCILLGRSRPPVGPTVRVIGSVKGEPSTPADPANGLVWQSILGAMYGEQRGTDAFDRIPEWSKRLHAGDRLGDLYQAQCDDARKGRALVQTPPFVRVLLMRETLGQSIEKFGIEETRFIDPACGTGHLLVDAFRILYHATQYFHPEWKPDRVGRYAMDRVTGVDLDPVCVEVAQYRLSQALYDATGWDGLTAHRRVYVGDSLLHHRPMRGDDLDDELVEVMQPGRFSAVAANPPYIVVKDKKSNAEYRARYESAYRRYSLGCPFTELCFGLGRKQNTPALPDVGDRVPNLPTGVPDRPLLA